MKPRLFVAISLAALWLFVLLAFLQHASPVNSSPVAHTSAAQFDVVINEVAWAGTSASANHEWIELKNNTALTISLANWRLRSADGSPSMTLSGQIAPLGYLLLARTNYTNVVDVPADMIYTGALVDTGEVLTLTDDLGNAIDTANSNGGPWPAGTGGTGTPPRATMERIDPLAPDTDDNWASNDGIIRNGLDANGNPINGTPKSRNSVTSANLGIIQLAPGTTVMNQAIQYTLIFSNAGKLNVEDAIITDTLSSSPTSVAQSSPYTFTQVGQAFVWQVGALLTASGNLSLTFTVTPAADFTGLLTSTAVITSEVADYRPDNNAYTVTTWIRPPVADLSISKSGPASVNAGHELTYTIVFSNVGEIDAAHVIITDMLPLSVTLVRGTLVWMTDSVPTGGQPFSLTVVAAAAPDAAPEAAGWLVNQVTITTVTSETVIVNNTATFTTQVTAQSADLSVNKSGPISATAGAEITYTIVFSNAGELDAANVIITDSLPLSVTFVRRTEAYSFSQPVSGTLVWMTDSVPTGGQPFSLTVVVDAAPDAAGWLVNQVTITTITSETLVVNNTATFTTQVTAQSADLSVDKSGPISVTAGAEITYTITLSNVGQLTAAGAHVTDTLPISVTFVRHSAPYSMTPDGRTLVWNVGDVLASAAPISWTVTGLVDLRFAGVLTNLVEAATASDEPFTANNSDQATTLVTPPSPVVLISGVLYDGYQLDDQDEAIQIINVGALPVNLKNYTVTDGTSPGVRFPADTFLLPYQRVWVTKDAAKFRDSFGFWPDFAEAVTGTVSSLTGKWPGLANSHGDVQVKDVAGYVVDRLVYGEEPLPFTGWSGPALSPYSVGALSESPSRPFSCLNGPPTSVAFNVLPPPGP